MSRSNNGAGLRYRSLRTSDGRDERVFAHDHQARARSSKLPASWWGRVLFLAAVAVVVALVVAGSM